ncbi:MAG: cellulase family glycosylhydrolase [Chloroflexi bacterium]|nr:cellulase family glycosylhydrolase [Chloroflexota bacterium]
MMQNSPERQPSLITRVADSRGIGCIINFLVIPALIILGLVLPPISLPDRIFDAGYRSVGKNGADFTDKDGTLLSISSDGMAAIGSTKMKFASVSRDAFLGKKAGDDMAKALAAFPPNLDLKSSVYVFTLKGDAPKDSFFSSPVPDDADPINTLDFYTWDGAQWQFQPGKFFLDDNGETSLGTLPQAIAIVQTKATPPTIAAEMVAVANLPKEGAAALVEVNPLGLTVKEDGSLAGTLIAVPPSQTYVVVPSITNIENGTTRSDYVTNMLVNDKSRGTHVQAISDYLVQNLLPGVEINYQGLKPEVREYFSKFVTELAAELHARGKMLTISVPLPSQVADDEYDTGAYDWAVIGKAADGIKLPSMTANNAYRTDGPMEKLLNWAVSRVSRYKLQFALDAQVQDRYSNQTSTRSYGDALKSLISDIKIEGLTETYAMPFQGVRFTANTPAGFSGFKRDEQTKAYVYTYKDEQGRDHAVYIETAESLTFKMALASRYNLRGVSFRGLIGTDTEPSVWQAIAQYKQTGQNFQQPLYERVWTVSDGTGKQIQVERRPLTGSDPVFVWTAAPVPDKYKIGAAIAVNGTPRPGQSVEVAVAIPTNTPTPIPTDTPVPTNTPSAPRPTNTPRPAAPPPGPAPVNAPGFFGYGMQVDPGNNISGATGQIKSMGFGWVKAQVPYGYFYPAPGQVDFSMMDRVVNAAQAQGLRVLFSIVKAPRWSRPPGDTDEGPPSDPATYAFFVSQVAARYKGKGMAYEIWNEQNLYYEWGGRGRKLNAGRYIELLKAAYTAIKAQDADAIVVSGAMTPTGLNDGDIAIDDQSYLNQMYTLGLKQYSDAIGAHPSGYNCPADGDWRSVTNPTAKFRGPFDNRSPSWCFRGTIEGYRNIMVANGDGGKRIWATEFGWATVDGLGVAPANGYGYAADNTEAQQAAWLVQAYQIGKASGYMGVMFTWCLNYNNPPGDEKSAFAITYANNQPRPSFGALAAMPK